MNKLYIYFFLGLVALPLAGFSGGMITSEKVHAATKSVKKGSSATFYGRLWVQYDSSDNSSSNNNKISSIRDDEGMGRVGLKGKSSIGNGYAVNYKVEYAIDIGDGHATGDSKDCSDATNCRSFALKQGWVGFLTPMGQ
ncbi:MAG: hypothetical protein VX890_04125, partial [Pseudomonadota bacterium]|nr:hypothetical protein [Pseudomonadota bacterium]